MTWFWIYVYLVASGVVGGIIGSLAEDACKLTFEETVCISVFAGLAWPLTIAVGFLYGAYLFIGIVFNGFSQLRERLRDRLRDRLREPLPVATVVNSDEK